MIYGQMNPEVAAALRGRLGIGMGIKNVAPASYQAPQFPGGMSQYTPQPHLPEQWGQMPQNTGIVPPHLQGPWGQPQNNPYQSANKFPSWLQPALNHMNFSGGASLPPPTPIHGPASIPAPTPIGGPKSEIQQLPGATIPQENPIQAPRQGLKQGPANRGFMLPSWY